MGRIASELETAAKAAHISLATLSPDDAAALRSSIVERYGDSESKWPLWEHGRLSVAIHDPQAWRWIEEFVGDAPCLLFFNPTDDTTIFYLHRGADLMRLLRETSGFEFYVSDRPATYVICFNHHDVLVVGGSAENWLKARGQQPARGHDPDVA
jgi:hypothetical protein